MAPQATCGVRSHVVHTFYFSEYCHYLKANNPHARVFWLEYRDLYCATDAAMAALFTFLDLPDEPLKRSKLVKLTANVDELIPHYADFARQIAKDTFVKQNAFKDALTTADNCHTSSNDELRARVAGFCPLDHPQREYKGRRRATSHQEER
mmetsp:Transcript_27273/g.88118  ORF Transcript_27273/g.88118 Transcript_27273/m.88118 type:complete len:151 (+) Transcript_27273:118-570(+)